jgi:phage gp36-like protein
MAYSNVDDVRIVLSPNGDPLDEDTPSSYSDDQLEDCISRADAQIDTYLRSVYIVPVAAPDVSLRDWSSAIAAYLAVLVQANGDDIEKTDPIQLRYDRALNDLRMVAAGTLVLPYPLETTDDAQDVAVVNRYEGDLFHSSEFFASSDPYTYRNTDTYLSPGF